MIKKDFKAFLIFLFFAGFGLTDLVYAQAPTQINRGINSNNIFIEPLDEYQLETARVNSFTDSLFSIVKNASPGQILDLIPFNYSYPVNDSRIYTWYVNDYIIDLTPISSVAIHEPGNYKITLVIDDGNGLPNSIKTHSQIVKINASPTPVIDAVESTYEYTVSFSGADSFDDETEITSWSWDFGDGNKATGENVTHTFTQAGRYVVRLSVDDGNQLRNSISTISQVVTIRETPIADFIALAAVAPNEEFVLDASLNKKLDERVTEFSWLLNGEQIGETEITKLRLQNAGMYEITLLLYDDSNPRKLINQASKNIKVNLPPVAVIDFNPQNPVPGELITFSADESSDPDGEIVSYVWEFLDGTILEGKEVQKPFIEGGRQFFTLTVTDNDSASNSSVSTEELIILNYEPYVVTERLLRSNTLGVKLDATETYDLDNDNLVFEWTLPDGTKRSEASFTWQAPDVGAHVIGLDVNDGRNLANSVTSETIQVIVNRAVKPVVEEEIFSCTGQTILFNSSNSYDPDGDPFTANWTLSNGVTFSEPNPSYQFTKPGIYEARLSLKDEYSEIPSVATIPIIIEGSPIAKLNVIETTVCLNTPVSFDASESTDPSGSTPSFSWDMGDGSSRAGEKITHIFTEPGEYTVNVSVIGSGSGRCGNIAQASTVIRVVEGPVADFILPESVSPNQPIELDANESTTQGDIVSAIWVIENEFISDTVRGITASYMFEEAGDFFVTLIIETNTGTNCDVVSTSKTIRVNKSPTIVWELPDVSVAGNDIFLDATGSFDEDGYVKSYRWFYNGELVGVNSGEVLKSVSPGRNTIRLEITDNSLALNNTVSSEKTFYANASPKPRIITPPQAYQNDRVTFRTNSFVDADGDSLSSTWFVDGVEVEQPSFVMEEFRRYRIVLVQDDGRGLSNSVDSAAVIYSPINIPKLELLLPDNIVIGNSLTANQVGLPSDWKFKQNGVLVSSWRALELGNQNIEVVWKPEDRELSVSIFRIEVVRAPQ